MTKTNGLSPRILYEDANYQLADLPIVHIHIPKDRFRAVQTQTTDEALHTTLQDLPLLNEIGVKSSEHGYELIYGESRYWHLSKQGKDTLRCKIWKVDPDTALYMELAENAARGTYSKAQLLDYVNKLSKSKKLKNKDVARLIGIDKSEVTKLTTIAEMSPKLKTLFIEKNVPIDVMYDLRVLESDAARENALNSVLLQNYSKDAARHFIHHTLAGLCDNCGLTGTQRKSMAPLQFHVGQWFCQHCLPEKPKREEPAKQTDVEQTNKTSTEPATTTGPEETYSCARCGEPIDMEETYVDNCASCASRMTVLLDTAIATFGNSLFKRPPADLARLQMQFSSRGK